MDLPPCGCQTCDPESQLAWCLGFSRHTGEEQGGTVGSAEASGEDPGAARQGSKEAGGIHGLSPGVSPCTGAGPAPSPAVQPCLQTTVRIVQPGTEGCIPGIRGCSTRPG